jgi:hypothetical protein
MHHIAQAMPIKRPNQSVSATLSFMHGVLPKGAGEVIMSVDLPDAVARYFAAQNRTDAAGLARCFTEHAIVRDEGRTIERLAAIAQWKAEAIKKYQYTVAPLAAAWKDGATVVTCRLTGNLPGSPIDLQFVFVLDGDKIASLEIHP